MIRDNPVYNSATDSLWDAVEECVNTGMDAEYALNLFLQSWDEAQDGAAKTQKFLMKQAIKKVKSK